MRAKRVRAIRDLTGWSTKDSKEIGLVEKVNHRTKMKSKQRFSSNKTFREFKTMKRLVNRGEFRRTA